MRFLWPVVICWALSPVWRAWSTNADSKALQILAKSCVECHNSHDKKGDVVLDRGPLQLDDLQLIIDAVSGAEPEMPPKRPPLSAEQISHLKQWINSGADFPEDLVLKDTRVANLDWWSLKPLTNTQIPSVYPVHSTTVQGTVPDRTLYTDKKWPRNEIDHFVLAGLRKNGLSPSPEADAQTLIRRLTFDLTGLPPTPDEIRDFVTESSTQPNTAYEKLVDRLLASPRYGEQWARHWLDVARYGESHGYDKDKARFNAWPYRDYVIKSFNTDKPWSRFVQEQVAGDVLWPDDPGGIIALGFIAAGPWDFIAHTEVGESKVDGRIAKHLDRDDMVSVVFNAFMSTTVQCAQCHNHKFDPVSMQDYYRLHTIFAGVDRADRLYDLDPELVEKRLKLDKSIAQTKQDLSHLDSDIEKQGGKSLKMARQAVSALEKLANFKSVPEHGYHSQIEKSQNNVKWIQFELPTSKGIGEKGQIRLIGAFDDYAGIGAGFGFPLKFKIETANNAAFNQEVKLVANYSQDDYPNPGVTPVEIPGGEGRFIRITATKLAPRKDDYIFALGEVELTDANNNNLAAGAKITSKDSIESGNRWGRKNLTDGKFAVNTDPSAVKKLDAAKKKFSDIYSKLETPERVSQRESLQKILAEHKKALKDLPAGKMVYSLATDFKPRSQFKPTRGVKRAINLLNRGDITTPGDLMQPGAPALWPGISAHFELTENHSEGERRTALARYLTAPENPLLWRSGVNRIWLGHFGRGIVNSPNDFGRMGMIPTHPELLDWLAARFRKSESMKDIHKLIVMSATWRQSSKDDSQKSALDSGNTRYWRMNRRKLRAGELRDSILSAAGVLNLKMGGPGFQDFQFKDDHTPKYWYHLHDPNDPDTHRRTIYRFIARSQTHPFLTTLDCADPSLIVGRRDETTTVLQALALMNNPFMIAMSEKLAKRSLTIDEILWHTLGREITAQEKQLFASYRDKHGMAALARLIFNLNEFVFLD